MTNTEAYKENNNIAKQNKQFERSENSRLKPVKNNLTNKTGLKVQSYEGIILEDIES